MYLTPACSDGRAGLGVRGCLLCLLLLWIVTQRSVPQLQSNTRRKTQVKWHVFNRFFFLPFLSIFIAVLYIRQKTVRAENDVLTGLCILLRLHKVYGLMTEVSFKSPNNELLKWTAAQVTCSHVLKFWVWGIEIQAATTCWIWIHLGWFGLILNPFNLNFFNLDSFNWQN